MGKPRVRGVVNGVADSNECGTAMRRKSRAVFVKPISRTRNFLRDMVFRQVGPWRLLRVYESGDRYADECRVECEQPLPLRPKLRLESAEQGTIERPAGA